MDNIPQDPDGGPTSPEIENDFGDAQEDGQSSPEIQYVFGNALEDMPPSPEIENVFSEVQEDGPPSPETENVFGNRQLDDLENLISYIMNDPHATQQSMDQQPVTTSNQTNEPPISLAYLITGDPETDTLITGIEHALNVTEHMQHTSPPTLSDSTSEMLTESVEYHNIILTHVAAEYLNTILNGVSSEYINIILTHIATVHRNILTCLAADYINIFLTHVAAEYLTVIHTCAASLHLEYVKHNHSNCKTAAKETPLEDHRAETNDSTPVSLKQNGADSDTHTEGISPVSMQHASPHTQKASTPELSTEFTEQPSITLSGNSFTSNHEGTGGDPTSEDQDSTGAASTSDQASGIPSAFFFLHEFGNGNNHENNGLDQELISANRGHTEETPSVNQQPTTSAPLSYKRKRDETVPQSEGSSSKQNKRSCREASPTQGLH